MTAPDCAKTFARSLPIPAKKLTYRLQMKTMRTNQTGSLKEEVLNDQNFS